MIMFHPMVWSLREVFFFCFFFLSSFPEWPQLFLKTWNCLNMRDRPNSNQLRAFLHPSFRMTHHSFNAECCVCVSVCVSNGWKSVSFSLCLHVSNESSEWKHGWRRLSGVFGLCVLAVSLHVHLLTRFLQNLVCAALSITEQTGGSSLALMWRSWSTPCWWAEEQHFLLSWKCLKFTM